MTEEPEQRTEDKDPEPIKHSDAERVGGEETASPQEFEDDPARNPEEQPVRDVKGG